MTYEENLRRLDAIVSELDGDEVALDRALQLFEEGIARLREAAAELARAEAQVKQLVETSEGAFELPDFEG